ncbi:chemotaxis protein CheA [Desulfolutivibrio sulfodismutans]|nr:chemotaxis protein CheA [Desulfolutivibrio sulfodismutans]
MRDLFMEEVGETLAELDTALLELEKAPHDAELINRIFRGVHTLKGACDMFGVDDAVALAHAVESVFDHVRGGWRDVDKALMDLAFSARDRFAAMLAEGADPAAEKDEALLQAFRDLLRTTNLTGSQTAAPAAPGVVAPEAPTAPAAATFRIRFAPRRTEGVLAILDELRGLGECRVEADLAEAPLLPDFDPAVCPARFTVLVTTDKGENALRDVFLFLDDSSEATIEAVEEWELSDAWQAPAATAAGDAPEVLAEPAPDGPGASQAAPTAAPAVSRESGASIPVAPVPPEEPVAPEAAKAVRKAAPKEAVHSLRVDAVKLDELVNLVGELVIAQARLSQLAGDIRHPALTGVAEEIERLSNELRDNTLGIRMLPIGTTFSRFRRLVRDLSSDMQKQIELVTEGGETELDKTVIEQLGDPLVHLLRNSIDHGIEPPRERMECGKPPVGKITLSAEHAGGEVLIHIIDDGRGMNPEKIRAKAVEKGLIPSDARMTDAEIFNLIFLPGFSTAEKVTNVSGRGVGMDVVKRGIDSLRGKIDIQSDPGAGSRIIIKLPLTLAIIDGLQVRSGGEHYIIPLSLVEECVELSRQTASLSGRNRTIHLRGEIVPYIRLREVFGLPGDAPAIEQVVVTRHEGERAGLAVDEVVGQQQTVIKSLGNYIGSVEGISGATINGDGSMSLILDVPTLVASVKRQAA